MRSLVTIPAVVLLTWCVYRAFADPGATAKPEKRIVPPTVFLSFPESVQVDTVYIYPSSIAFLPRRGLEPRAKLSAELSNLHERPPYNRKVSCTYLADDHTFWLSLPKDVPSEVSVGFTLNR